MGFEYQPRHIGAQVVHAAGSRALEPIASAVHANVCRRDLFGGLLREYYRAAA